MCKKCYQKIEQDNRIYFESNTITPINHKNQHRNNVIENDIFSLNWDDISSSLSQIDNDNEEKNLTAGGNIDGSW